MALNKGAQAVIFDVSVDASAAAEVTTNPNGEKIVMYAWTLQAESYILHLLLFPALTCVGQLRETDSLPRPVVLVDAENAEELMGLVNKNEEANVRIESMPPVLRWVSDF